MRVSSSRKKPPGAWRSYTGGTKYSCRLLPASIPENAARKPTSPSSVRTTSTPNIFPPCNSSAHSPRERRYACNSSAACTASGWGV